MAIEASGSKLSQRLEGSRAEVIAGLEEIVRNHTQAVSTLESSNFWGCLLICAMVITGIAAVVAPRFNLLFGVLSLSTLVPLFRVALGGTQATAMHHDRRKLGDIIGWFKVPGRKLCIRAVNRRSQP